MLAQHRADQQLIASNQFDEYKTDHVVHCATLTDVFASLCHNRSSKRSIAALSIWRTGLLATITISRPPLSKQCRKDSRINRRMRLRLTQVRDTFLLTTIPIRLIARSLSIANIKNSGQLTRKDAFPKTASNSFRLVRRWACEVPDAAIVHSDFVQWPEIVRIPQFRLRVPSDPWPGAFSIPAARLSSPSSRENHDSVYV